MDLEVDIVKIFLAFVVLMNPFGALMAFLDLTQGYSKRERRMVAQLTALSVLITITLFVFGGNWLLQALGISIGAFQVSGGSLLFLIAISMVMGRENAAKPKVGNSSDQEIALKPSAASRARVGEIAVVPLAIPIIVGPGGISTVIIYAASAKTTVELIGVLVAGSGIALLCLLSLLAASRVSELLGQTGLAIMNRIMGLLLAAVSVEIVTAGIKSLFPHLGG